MVNNPGSDYTYDISIEDLRRYATLSPAEILRWLQEYNQFILQALPPDSQNAAQLFRQGKI
jgi:hypothetical protein